VSARPVSGDEIPLFPLHAVLFPGGLLALRIFEQRYLEMAKTCLRDDAPFGVCLIREGREVGVPAIPAEVGCLARIVHWEMPQLGLLQVKARGEQRFRIRARRVRADGLALARIEPLPEDTDAPVAEQYAMLRRLLERLLEQGAAALVAEPRRLDSSAWVSARLAEIVPLPLAARQRLLELADGPARLAALARLLEPQS
jgi:Lon protease-like protein